MSQIASNNYTFKLYTADTNLQATAGELVLLQGAEGNGKSTWLKRIAGLVKPPAGILIETKGTIRMLFDQQPPIWLGQNVGEELCFGLKVAPDNSALNVSLQQWGLPGLKLSSELKGLNRLESIRLSIAAMTLAEPSLVLIDAQTDGLSAEATTRLSCEISDWAKSRQVTVVVACNRWHDWESVATQTWYISSTENLPQKRDKT